MPRNPNTESGRVTLALTSEAKALLVQIASQQGFSLAQVVQHALPIYEEWLAMAKERVSEGLAQMAEARGGAAKRSRKQEQ